MARSTHTKKVTRIQREKTETILEAALDVFAAHGFRGSTLDMVSQAANLSKPNLLYYFDSKEAMHAALLERLLANWLEPMAALDADGEPVEEICAYVQRKLEMSRDYPRESRLFANEILQGAPRILQHLQGPLRDLVVEKAAVISAWIDQGRLAPLDPEHLIFMIWSSTQHYADFDVQVRAVTAADHDPFDVARGHLNVMFRRMITPAKA